jgi:5,10-methylenetetrahydromethanopterin reductase
MGWRCRPACRRIRCAKGAAKEGRDPTTLRRAGYIFFGSSNAAGEAVDAVRAKLAFVMRNKFLAQNIKDSGIPVDHEAVIAAIARRDVKAAAALVPDEAVEAFAVAGSPEHCLRRLRDFVDAGIDEPVLSLVGPPQSCAFAIEVMRKFAA